MLITSLIRLTKLFPRLYITQRAICDYLALHVPVPHNILLLRRMIKHGSKPKYHRLRLPRLALAIRNGPIT